MDKWRLRLDGQLKANALSFKVVEESHLADKVWFGVWLEFPAAHLQTLLLNRWRMVSRC